MPEFIRFVRVVVTFTGKRALMFGGSVMPLNPGGSVMLFMLSELMLGGTVPDAREIDFLTEDFFPLEDNYCNPGEHKTTR